ncbi:snake venom vascular endothelial growth factor toxin ICPP-like [Emys orbicularis]|uniref:snake venom vascular endothelial growth factor toxin ICPP-like n=1 Tax=Emys orbicularis TaxID=82168 RepID=UPI0031FE0743
MGPGSRWLLGAALLCWGARCQVAPPLGRTAAVVPFEEVWSRSYCRALETLVDVLGEFPHEAEHVFKPSCVPLRRCAGCCGDEDLECVAVETRPVAMQVVRLSPIQGKSQQEEMRFTEHSRCACRPRRKRLKSERDSKRGARRRPREPGPVPLPTPLCQPPSQREPRPRPGVKEPVLPPGGGPGCSPQSRLELGPAPAPSERTHVQHPGWGAGDPT